MTRASPCTPSPRSAPCATIRAPGHPPAPQVTGMCVGCRPVPAVQPHEHHWRWAAGCRGKVCRAVPLISGSLVADAAPAHPHLRHWYRIDAGRGLDPTFRSMACGQPAPTTTTTLHAQKAPGRGGIVVCACGGTRLRSSACPAQCCRPSHPTQARARGPPVRPGKHSAFECSSRQANCARLVWRCREAPGVGVSDGCARCWPTMSRSLDFENDDARGMGVWCAAGARKPRTTCAGHPLVRVWRWCACAWDVHPALRVRAHM